MNTLRITLDAKLEEGLARIAKRTGRTRSNIAREALERYVAVAHFRDLRTTVLPFAEAQALLTDADIFRVVS